ncbi:hypothetical protein [Allosphingosinicella deserti]|uniref:Uncharacterized protein n=1 Tax=Allosphingosinicella deserti TaxID=2116704 RepID=A0A2P7QNE7_9SPHN|nr:hypothetical protein [Sphingomonas deserti]PSJ39476.1 hypothetical protein C7I55_12760 [Sphingomonas deserti]
MPPLLPLVLFTVATAAPARSGDVIPEAFHGEWAVDIAQCSSKGADNVEGMTISADAITRYEDGVAITRVEATGRNSIRYQGMYANYDEEAPTSGTLLLSADGNRLIGAGYAEGPDGKGPDLLRCPRS